MVLLSHVCATRARPSSMGALPTQIAELRWTQVVMRLLKHHESNHTSILSLYRDVRLFTTRTKKLDRHLTVFQGSCAHPVELRGAHANGDDAEVYCTACKTRLQYELTVAERRRSDMRARAC